MTHARKFIFDTEFSADGKILRETTVAAPRLTPEEVEAERKRAYEAGKKDAEAQAERDAAAALRDLATAAAVILTRLDAESRALRDEARLVATLAARKIAGAALEKFGADTAAEALTTAMDALRSQPRLIVKLAPDAAVALRARVDELRDAHAYAGAVLVRDDASRGPGEVAIDWGDGVLTRDPAAIAQRIESLLDAALGEADPGAPS